MLNDLRRAISFLTILPVGFPETEAGGRTALFFPLVGGLIGLVLYLVASNPWLNSQATAFWVLLTWIIITGGLHLDGFADSCDALFATVSPERRLEIMKDPHIGTWGAVGLILLLLGKWIFIQDVPPIALLVIPVIGRLNMIYVVLHFPYARETGLGTFFRAGLGENQMILPLILVFGLLFFFIPVIGAFMGLFLTFALGVWLAGWASKRLGGGVTGDIYGLVCETTEFLGLLGLAIAD